MFSDNRRISDRQLQALLLTDWIGKIMLLQPGLARSYSGSAVFPGTAAGLLLTAVLLLLIMRGAWSSPVDCYSYMQKHEGKLAAVVLYLVYGIYFLEQTILLLFLCGEIAEIYLLPETSRPVLMVLPAAVGYFLARGGLEIRGRVSELLAWLLAAFLFLMLFLVVFQIHPGKLWEAVAIPDSGYRVSSLSISQGVQAEVAEIGMCIYLTAGGFGSIFAIPLVLSGAEQKKGWKRKLYLAFGMTALLLVLVYLTGYGIFGSAGMKRLSWPVISLMTCVNFHGMFLQRWDILFAALLLTSLFLSVGSGLYYMEKVCRTLWENSAGRKQLRKQENVYGEQRHAGEEYNVREFAESQQDSNPIRDGLHQDRTGRQLQDGLEGNRTGNRIRLGCLGLAYLLALGLRDWEQALYFYEGITFWFCLPVLALLVLLVRRKRRTRAVICAFVLLTAVAFALTGCSARELESRCFPLVLEINVSDGRLVLGCAWPAVKENGGKQSQDNTAGSNEKAAEEKEEKAGQGIETEVKKPDESALVNDEKITRVTGKNLEDTLKNLQSLRDKYVDYSQVKAILWGRELENNAELEQEVLEWLEQEPAFSRNILVFQGKNRDLSLETIQEHAQGQPGAYLENLYKNNEVFQEYTKTLYELLY